MGRELGHSPEKELAALEAEEIELEKKLAEIRRRMGELRIGSSAGGDRSMVVNSGEQKEKRPNDEKVEPQEELTVANTLLPGCDWEAGEPGTQRMVMKKDGKDALLLKVRAAKSNPQEVEIRAFLFSGFKYYEFGDYQHLFFSTDSRSLFVGETISPAVFRLPKQEFKDLKFFFEVLNGKCTRGEPKLMIDPDRLVEKGMLHTVRKDQL